MVTNKLLVRKEIETGKVLSQQLLFDDETTEHMIISDLPVIEEKEGFSGHYIVSSTGQVTIKYTEIPKSPEEILQNQINLQDQIIADLMLEVAMLKKGGVIANE